MPMPSRPRTWARTICTCRRSNGITITPAASQDWTRRLLCSNEQFALDPDYALAKALFARVVVVRDTGGWSSAEDKTKAVSLAREAIHSNRDDPDTLRFAAHTLSHIAHDYELALSTIARAVRLYPNSAQVLSIAGWVHLHAGVYQPALGYFEQAIRLSPLDQEMGVMLYGPGAACLCSGTQ